MSVSQKTHSERRTDTWMHLVNLMRRMTLAELGRFNFSNFALNREQRINEVLSVNHLLETFSELA